MLLPPRLRPLAHTLPSAHTYAVLYDSVVPKLPTLIDNAPVHTAKVIQHFLKRHHIPVERHPPYTLDLNPIEHVWVYLKRYLQAKYPDIANTPVGPDAVRARLAEVLPEAWEAIPVSVFESFWRSMPNRVAAITAEN